MNRREISPALMGSAALHLAVAAALLISWRHPRDLKIGAVVPVTIVSDAPAAELSPASEAPQDQAAQVEEPVPTAPPQPVPPAPQPTPPAPNPSPSAKPAPAPAKTTAPQPTPAKAEKRLDLDALAASVSKIARPASGAKGPTRAATAPQARTGAGEAAVSAALNGLADELQRRWNPNCAVADARQVVVAVTFTLNSGGGVVGAVRGQLTQGAQTPAANTAADRAISAVYAAAPFRSLPQEVYGQPIRVNFDARKACS